VQVHLVEVFSVDRHSGSVSARISLARSPGGVEFEISDDGRGISAERLQQMHAAAAGVGLLGMKERLRQFGGTLQLSSDQNGTRVAGVLPIPTALMKKR
jgi:two-component system, NarL family, sensor kinase